MSDLHKGECRLYSAKTGSSLTMTVHDYEEVFRFVAKADADGPQAYTVVCDFRSSDARHLRDCLNMFFGGNPLVQTARPELRQWAISQVMQKAENFDTPNAVEDIECWTNRLISFVSRGHMKLDDV